MKDGGAVSCILPIIIELDFLGCLRGTGIPSSGRRLILFNRGRLPYRQFKGNPILYDGLPEKSTAAVAEIPNCLKIDSTCCSLSGLMWISNAVDSSVHPI